MISDSSFSAIYVLNDLNNIVKFAFENNLID